MSTKMSTDNRIWWWRKYGLKSPPPILLPINFLLFVDRSTRFHHHKNTTIYDSCRDHPHIQHSHTHGYDDYRMTPVMNENVMIFLGVSGNTLANVFQWCPMPNSSTRPTSDSQLCNLPYLIITRGRPAPCAIRLVTILTAHQTKNPSQLCRLKMTLSKIDHNGIGPDGNKGLK